VTRFDYFRPAGLVQACEFLSAHSGWAKVIAGGTDLLIAVRRGQWPPAGSRGAEEQGAVPIDNLSPERTRAWVVDVSCLQELRGIRDHEGLIVSIGAACTHTQVAESTEIKRFAPMLAVASESVGSVQIRNRGTIGGNIMNASPAADTLPALVALDARAVLVSPSGTRELAVAELVTGPYRTCAREDEILARVEFQKLPQGARMAFTKLGRRSSMAIARLSCAVALVPGPDGTVREARISAGAAFPRPVRIGAAEEVLVGRVPDAEAAREAGEKAALEMVRVTGVRWSTDYKHPVLSTLVARTIMKCLGREEGSAWAR
jgi:carbon-monoxide dehydrogenase medium subunit/xanthine dehydrogenase FAD-binding subunit